MTDRLRDQFDIDADAVRHITADTLQKADDGELFVERRKDETLVFDDGRLRTGNYSSKSRLWPSRCCRRSRRLYPFSALNHNALRNAADAAKSVTAGHSGTMNANPERTNKHLYNAASPLEAPNFDEKAKLYRRLTLISVQKSPKCAKSHHLLQAIKKLRFSRADGAIYKDQRPLVRINISVVVGEGDRQETGSHGMGGRQSLSASSPWINGKLVPIMPYAKRL